MTRRQAAAAVKRFREQGGEGRIYRQVIPGRGTFGAERVRTSAERTAVVYATRELDRKPVTVAGVLNRGLEALVLILAGDRNERFALLVQFDGEFWNVTDELDRADYLRNGGKENI